MKLFKKLLFILSVGITLSAVGQENSVGINTNTPNSNAVLDLISPDLNQGFLVPRLTSIRRNAMTPNLSNTENGLMIYDTNEGAFYYWRDGGWIRGLGILSSSDAGGDLTGTYPNPFIRSGAVTNLKLADLAVSVEKFKMVQ